MELYMVMTKKTTNFTVYSQCTIDQNVLPDTDAIIPKLYLRSSAHLPEMIKLTIEPMERI